MTSDVRRPIPKAILIIIVFSLLLPTPAFAIPGAPPAQPQGIIGIALVNDSPTVLGSSTGFTATVGGFTPITYTWNFGDGTAEVAALSNLVTYPYGVAGFYTTIVTVTDGGLNTISATTPVTITAPCISGLVVENTHDSDCGSLRYAVNIAVAGDTVTFTPTLAGQTITLTTGQIDIHQSITIDGAAAPGIIISGNDTDRVFNISAQNDVTLNALSVVHGWVGEDTGAGISNAGTLTVSNSTVAYNTGMLGGGIYNGGTLTLLKSTLSFNIGFEGSGFYNSGIATVLDDSFTQNEASWSGGGVYNSFDAVLTMTNSTLSTNRVMDVEMGSGGGLLNSGTLTLINTTFYSNTSPVSDSGGGLYNHEGASLSLVNTLIAHSVGGDCYNIGTITSNINNLIEDGSCNVTLSGDPLLDPLANNGGTTLTHLPQTDSPAIDAGDNASAAGLTYDQRGHGYPRLSNGLVDIGAVEVAAAIMPILTATNDSPTVLGRPTNLTATLSSPLSPAPTFTWDFGDGFTGVGATPAHPYAAAGFYTATVQAANGVLTLTATTPVTITEQFLLNLVAINDSPTLLGSTTNFLASVSGDSATFEWDFGDGTQGTGQSSAHIYGAVGFYTAIVTATNSVSLLTTTTQVTITGPALRYSTYLPLIMNNFFTAPDLIVQNIIASRDAITVVIQNVGDAPADQSFWVDAYIAPNPPPTAVNQIWWDQNRAQQGIAWAVIDPMVPIQPGAVITLTSTDLYVSPERTYFTGNLPVGTPIYAQVDSYNFYTNYGAVQEQHEILGLPYNNIFGPVFSVSVGGPLFGREAQPGNTGWRESLLPLRPEQP
ncbi:Collagenase ColH [Thermoflexales bacterium]|nr:Collagenase ColH [Thermoflexales bacterium]